MDKAYGVADVVVSRAGALSVSELCIVGRPAILVPLPTAAEDHQTKNAMSLVERDAALLVNDRTARDELVNTTIQLLGDKEKCATLSLKIKQLGKPNAAREIAAEVINLVK